MRKHLLSLLGLFASAAVAVESESHMRLLQHLHPDAIADFTRYTEAKEGHVVEGRHEPRESSHDFLNEQTKRKLPLVCPVAMVLSPDSCHHHQASFP